MWSPQSLNIIVLWHFFLRHIDSIMCCIAIQRFRLQDHETFFSRHMTLPPNFRKGPDYILSTYISKYQLPFSGWLRIVQSFAFLLCPGSLTRVLAKPFGDEVVAKALRMFPQFDSFASSCYGVMPRRKILVSYMRVLNCCYI